jgi:hypothetical protein
MVNDVLVPWFRAWSLSPRDRHRTDREDFVRAQRLDGIFGNRDNANRLAKGIEQFQDTSSRARRRVVHEIDQCRDVARAKGMLRKRT